MKKRAGIRAAAAVCILVMGMFLFRGQRPYRNLKASDLISASVCLTPPDETVPITEPDALVSCLRELVIGRKDQSYTEYNGHAVTFTLVLTDGSRQEILVCNPFVVINGTGYRAEYGPCERLSSYANKLLDRTK